METANVLPRRLGPEGRREGCASMETRQSQNNDDIQHWASLEPPKRPGITILFGQQKDGRTHTQIREKKSRPCATYGCVCCCDFGAQVSIAGRCTLFSLPSRKIADRRRRYTYERGPGALTFDPERSAKLGWAAMYVHTVHCRDVQTAWMLLSVSLPLIPLIPLPPSPHVDT